MDECKKSQKASSAAVFLNRADVSRCDKMHFLFHQISPGEAVLPKFRLEHMRSHKSQMIQIPCVTPLALEASKETHMPLAK
jgi:hypothetical protein